MSIPSLPQTLIPAVSFLAWFAVNWLKHSKLPTWGNALIALLVPVFIAVIWGIAINVFTAQNLWGDIAAIILLSYAALALPELASWRAWLQNTFNSPFAMFASHHRTVEAAPAIIATPPPMTPYPAPQGIDLRGSAWPPARVPRYPLDDTLKPMPPVLPTGSVRIVAAPATPSPTTPAVTPQPTEPMETPAPVEEQPEQS